MKGFLDLIVGHEVMVINPNFRPRRCRVEKVGRKYLTVRGEQFDRASGMALRDTLNHLERVEDYEARKAAEEAATWLRGQGITVLGPPARVMEIHDILKSALTRPEG